MAVYLFELEYVHFLRFPPTSLLLSDTCFLHQYKNHFYSDGHSELKAKIILEKEIDFDGYKGVLKKEAIYPLDDFELITLVEKVEDK